MYPFIDSFALLSAILAVVLLFKIKKMKRRGKLKKALTWVFSLITLSFIFNALAEISWTFLDKVLGVSPELGVPDVLWIVGQSLVLAGFAYFAFFMYKEHGKLKSGLVLSSVASIFSAFLLYYLIGNFILGFQVGESLFEIFLDYFYPIIAAMIFITTVSVFLFFKQLKELGTPLLLLAVGAVFTFTGDMLYTYYSWNDIYGILGVLSDFFYGVDYLLATIALYFLLTKWVGMKGIGELVGALFGGGFKVGK